MLLEFWDYIETDISVTIRLILFFSFRSEAEQALAVPSNTLLLFPLQKLLLLL